MAALPGKNASRSTGALALLLLSASTAAWGTGFAPFAQPDSATVSRGGTVSVLDSGQTSVLANDFDIERDPLTAILDRDVKHGTLTLNEDGTFVYRHNGNDEEEDRFEYRAFDGTRRSRRARVTIRILPGDPIAPVIVGQEDIRVPEDESAEIRLADLKVEDPDSSYPQDFTLSVRDGNNYERVDNTIIPDPDFNGSLSVPVQVNDGTNDSNVFDLAVDVTPVNDPPFVTDDVPDQVAQEDQAFQLDLAAFFADIDSSELDYEASGLPASGSLALDSGTGVLAGTPVLADTRDEPYTVSVTARDPGGASAELDFILTVFPRDRADLSLSLKVTPQPAEVGENGRWELRIENLGPADLDEGLLRADWFSSDPPLELVADSACTVENNGSTTPGVQCTITNLTADTGITLVIESAQELAGDTTAIATVSAEDPDTSNNSDSDSLNVAAGFAEGAAQTLSLPGADVASGDLDNDGFLDLIVTGRETQILWNTGERALSTEATSVGAIPTGAAVVLTDWNMDGSLDVAVASGGDEPSMIYLNTGSRTFDAGRAVAGLRGRRVAAAAAIDVNNDGIAELVFAGSNGTVILSNDGQGNPSGSLLALEPSRDVVGADLNQDGFTDIMVVSAVDRALRIFTNDGNGFSSLALREGSVASVTPADVNGDGAIDLLLAVDGDDLQVATSRVLANDGGGRFSRVASLGASPTARLLSGDVDGDGLQDIVAVKQTGVHQLYAARQDGGFGLAAEQIVSTGMFEGLLTDINADQSLDLILVGEAAGRVEMHFNDGAGRFGLGDVTPPQITLEGEAVVSLDVGDPFSDPGATAVDDIDGDLTDSLLVDNPVNTALVGTYTVTYSVADRAGNSSQAQRTVRVAAVTGVGGGGGGALGPAWLLLLACLAVPAAVLAGRPAR